MSNRNVKSLWRPEYGAYMIEGTPGKPYGGLLAHFNVVEANMRYRRQEATKLLKPGEVLMSLTNFPRYSSKCSCQSCHDIINIIIIYSVYIYDVHTLG